MEGLKKGAFLFVKKINGFGVDNSGAKKVKLLSV